MKDIKAKPKLQPEFTAAEKVNNGNWLVMYCFVKTILFH